MGLGNLILIIIIYTRTRTRLIPRYRAYLDPREIKRAFSWRHNPLFYPILKLTVSYDAGLCYAGRWVCTAPILTWVRHSRVLHWVGR